MRFATLKSCVAAVLASLALLAVASDSFGNRAATSQLLNITPAAPSMDGQDLLIGGDLPLPLTISSLQSTPMSPIATSFGENLEEGNRQVELTRWTWRRSGWRWRWTPKKKKKKKKAPPTKKKKKKTKASPSKTKKKK